MRGIVILALCIFLLIVCRYSEPFRNAPSGKNGAHGTHSVRHGTHGTHGTHGVKHDGGRHGERHVANSSSSWGPFSTWFPFMWWLGDEDDCVLEPCHDIRWY